jgi:predicted HD phosphohydrolase
VIETVDDLFEVLTSGAARDDGEALDLLAHGLQCAALLAEQAPDDLELQVAGLVHDVGTVLEPSQPATHAATGADATAALLGRRVATLVGHHDHAKRYLVTTDPNYHGVLSPQSVVTLGEQGGPMDERERAAFEAGDDYDALVSLRRADDAAKVQGRLVPGLETWRAALETIAGAHR